jgi:glutaredoxin 3
MAKIEIYTRPWCGYCARAKALLQRKGQEFTEFDLESEPAREAEMVVRAGGATAVPQIFIDGRHVGGSDNLHALDRQGKLDPLLRARS